jgi:hypothetical protein
MSDTYDPIGPTATHFHDMHSGGTLKTDYHHIFVELPEQAAREWFAEQFGENPDAVACSCCGPNFSVTQATDLVQATAYERNCEFVSVEGESGGGHYIEEAKTLDMLGRAMEHTPFEEYVDEAASVVGKPAANDSLVVQAATLGSEWAASVEDNS